jgi:TonB family protein
MISLQPWLLAFQHWLLTFLHWLLTFLLNSLWQVPLIALAAITAARLMTPASWRLRHLIYIASLLLAVILPAWSAATSTPKAGQSVTVSVLPGSIDDGASDQPVRHALIPHRYSTSLHIAPALSKTVVLAYLAILFAQAGFLLWKWRSTRKLLYHATLAQLPSDLSAQWQRWQNFFNIGSINLLISEQIAGPVTLGFRRASLMVPPGFIATATRDEAAAALCHELAHIARRDFVVNLFLEIVSLPIAFHPACWLLKKHIDESRELACDAMAASASNSSDVYARSLLSLAQTICAAPAGAVTNVLGIFEANILEKRIMHLIDRKPASTRAARLLSVAVGCSLLAATCVGISAFTLQPASAQAPANLEQYVGTWKTTVNGHPAATVQILSYQGKLTGSVSNGDFGFDEKANTITGWHDGTPGAAPIVEASISGQTLAFKTLDLDGTFAWDLTLTAPGKADLRVAEALPDGTKLPAIPAERIDTASAKDDTPNPGYTPPHLLHSVDPQYSPEARAAKFSGKCVVALTVDIEGNPINVHIEKPLGMGLDENAINAVKQYRFTPAVQDGVPIAKRLHVEVDFRYY